MWAAMATELVSMEQTRLAILLIRALAGYLRVMEMLGLRFGDFQAPSRHGVASWSLHLLPQGSDGRSKTCQTDESVPLDAKYLSALTPVYELFSQQPAAPL